MYESIGRYLPNKLGPSATVTYRHKLEFVNMIGSAMKTLFGVCDNDYAKETTDNIEKIEHSNERMIHLLKNQTTVVKSAIVGIGVASIEINKLYKELNDTQYKLEEKLRELINHTYSLDTLVLTNRIY